MNTDRKKRSPWAWIPTLYFAQGLPYVAVMTLSVIMYKRLGVSNTDIALYTGWLYLPWVVKPFWSPFIDIISTKRRWTLATQWIICVALAGVAFTIPAPAFFQLTLAVFWLVGFASATHDIAADGFYMLALTEHQQSLYVGIRSTFYRIATVAGQGLLVVIAGLIETSTGARPVTFDIRVDPNAEWAAPSCIPDAPTAEAAHDGLGFSVDMPQQPLSVNVPAVVVTESGRSMDYADFRQRYIDSLRLLNEANGFVAAASNTTAGPAKKISRDNGFTAWVKETFGEDLAPARSVPDNFAVVGVSLTRSPEPGEEVVLNVTFDSGDPGIRLEQTAMSSRLVFNSSNWRHTAYLVFEIDSRISSPVQARFVGASGNIPLAWSVVFVVLSIFFLAVALYHSRVMPKPAADGDRQSGSDASAVIHEFFDTFRSFFRKDGVVAAILFMLLYRLPEAQLVKLIGPFLLDPVDCGGLGLSTGEVGIVYGSVGIVGLTLGGIVGGIAAARGGLRRWLWPMAWSMSLTCLTFVYLSYFPTSSLAVVNICVFTEQFGYGFGFTAYMLYMIYFSSGSHKTSHYALCTGFMALGMMLPGMAAGWLQETVGYRHFFIWTIICCAATIAVCAFVKVDSTFGLKKKQ